MKLQPEFFRKRSSIHASSRLLRLLLSAAILLVGIVSCSKQRDLGPNSNGSAPAAKYSFPHAKDWSSSHISFYAQAGKSLEGTRQDCARCHDLRGKAASLNVSCATSCHSPTTSESRDGAGVAAPNPVVVVANTCTNCHSSLIPPNTQFMHFPAATGLCTTCHEVSKQHQEGKEKGGVKTKGANESCYQCHFKKDDHAHVHPAMTLGDPSCVNCHDPHGTQHRYFIRENSIGELCSNCHMPHEGKSVHGAEKFGKNCLNCHNPHSTAEPKLLQKAPEDLCLSCHNKEIPTQFAATPRVIPDIKKKMKEMPHQHTGALSGCLTCHQPHSSPNERLLTLEYSTSNYNRYDGDPNKGNPYGLCFMCHDPAMLEPANFNTGFRHEATANNQPVRKNLHWFHVRDAAGDADKSQGRSCRICHDPHGAQQEFHINDSWNMNGIQIPITFKKNADGGTCTSTCHASKTYRRGQ